jgi:hypothetical protein
MKTEYIDQIYQDFNTKTETTLKYLQVLKDKTLSTTEDIINFVKLYETLYSSLAQTKKTLQIPTDTQFAIEQQNVVNNNDQSANVKEISEKIATHTPLIEYKFEDLLKNLQFLTQSFQNYQDITNKIVEAWDDALQLLQS